MVVHDYPVKRLSLDDIERRASHFRSKCGIAPGSLVNVAKFLFDDMPEYLRSLGIALVERPVGHMGDREAYASPKAKRIFYRRSLLARLKFGDAGAAIIFLHELAHVLLHRDNGGAEKAWLREENIRVQFVSEEESAEWQATMLALCIMVPMAALDIIKSASELASAYKLDEKHAAIRYESLRRTFPRKVPEIYQQVRDTLAKKDQVVQGGSGIAGRREEWEVSDASRLCPECGICNLIEMNGKFYCKYCRNYGAKLQDGDTLGL